MRWLPTIRDKGCRRLQVWFAVWFSSQTFVIGMESRGFLVGLPLALALGVPFLMLRKPNKLPGEKASVSYGLEVRRVHFFGSSRFQVRI